MKLCLFVNILLVFVIVSCMNNSTKFTSEIEEVIKNKIESNSVPKNFKINEIKKNKTTNGTLFQFVEFEVSLKVIRNCTVNIDKSCAVSEIKSCLSIRNQSSDSFYCLGIGEFHNFKANETVVLSGLYVLANSKYKNLNSYAKDLILFYVKDPSSGDNGTKIELVCPDVKYIFETGFQYLLGVSKRINEKEDKKIISILTNKKNLKPADNVGFILWGAELLHLQSLKKLESNEFNIYEYVKFETQKAKVLADVFNYKIWDNSKCINL